MNKLPFEKMPFTARVAARQAIIAAVYVVLTLSGFGVSYGPVQFRYAEVMTWLAFFDPKNVIGLTLGCFVANMWSPFGAIDMVIGTLGTLLSTYFMAKASSKWIASLFPAAFSFLYSAEAWFLGEITGDLFLLVTAQIMLSQFIITALIGLPLWTVLWRNGAIRRALSDTPSARNDERGRRKIIS